MTHQVVQTRRFSRQYKKLHDNIAADVDAAIGAVATDPAIGDKKKVQRYIFGPIFDDIFIVHSRSRTYWPKILFTE